MLQGGVGMLDYQMEYMLNEIDESYAEYLAMCEDAEKEGNK